jgi:PKHD-type hydroxylase
MWPLKQTGDVSSWELTVDNVFTQEQLDLIDSFVKQYAYKTQVAKITTNANQSSSYRRTDLLWLDDLKELESIYKTVDELINFVNNSYYHWSLDYLEMMQYGVYKSKDQGFYDVHTDSRLHDNTGKVRKLSFSILANDPSEFDGGDFLIHDQATPRRVSLVKNQALFFPSFMPHSVTPVTQGVRKSIVGWIVGPNFV